MQAMLHGVHQVLRYHEDLKTATKTHFWAEIDFDLLIESSGKIKSIKNRFKKTVLGSFQKCA